MSRGFGGASGTKEEVEANFLKNKDRASPIPIIFLSEVCEISNIIFTDAGFAML
jgi:hypothetical protein